MYTHAARAKKNGFSVKYSRLSLIRIRGKITHSFALCAYCVYTVYIHAIMAIYQQLSTQATQASKKVKTFQKVFRSIDVVVITP